MKKGLILFLFSILVGQFSFAETDIQLMKGNPSFDPGDDHGIRLVVDCLGMYDAPPLKSRFIFQYLNEYRNA
jgi:hypothetical protein